MEETTGSWKARLECPQCGADVEQAAGDPVFTCPYCKTCLYMSSPGPLRYVLDAKNFKGNDLIFLPFWRFAGMRYLILKERQITASQLDTTASALALNNEFLSLGIAPQVQPLRVLTKSEDFFEPETSAKDSMEFAMKRINDFVDIPFIFEHLIAENKCLIYAPFILKDYALSLATGADYQWKVNDRDKEKLIQKPTKPHGNKYHLNFIPLICPECAHPIPPNKGALGLHCPYCSRLWFIKDKKGLVSLSYQVIETGTETRETVYLPFWHLHLSISNLPIQTRAELLLLAASYWRPPNSWHDKPVQLFVPAFKLNPRLFISLSKRMSLARDVPEEYGEKTRTGAHAEPVKISMKEASQAVKVVLAEIFMGNSKIYPLIPDSEIKITNAALTYVPYKPSGREYVNQWTGKTISLNAISLGRHI